MKYQVTARLTMDEEDVEPYLEQPFSPGVIGYQLIAGLSITYICPRVCRAGMEAGIIEPFEDPLPQLTYRNMRAHIGLDLHERLSGALAQAELSFLRRQLECQKSRPGTVEIRVNATEWYREGERLKEPELTLLEVIRVDLERRELLGYESRQPEGWLFPFPLFARVKTCAQLLEQLAARQSMEYMNTGDLQEQFRYSGFYDVDRFDQKLYRLDFLPDPLRRKRQEPEGPSPRERAEELDARYRALRAALEGLSPQPGGGWSREEEETARALRQEAEAFLEGEPRPRLYRISDRSSMEYTRLARRVVHALKGGNGAVMADVCRNTEPYSRLGDYILLLAAGGLWLCHPGNDRDPELWERAMKLARQAMLRCYITNQHGRWEERIPLFHHWSLICLPERERLTEEWMELLELTEEIILKKGGKTHG